MHPETECNKLTMWLIKNPFKGIIYYYASIPYIHDSWTVRNPVQAQNESGGIANSLKLKINYLYTFV